MGSTCDCMTPEFRNELMDTAITNVLTVLDSSRTLCDSTFQEYVGMLVSCLVFESVQRQDKNVTKDNVLLMQLVEARLLKMREMILRHTLEFMKENSGAGN